MVAAHNTAARGVPEVRVYNMGQTEERGGDEMTIDKDYHKVLRALKIGERLTLPHGDIHRHSRHVYALNDHTNRSRNRWGTLQEIAKDMDYFLTTGRLPSPVCSITPSNTGYTTDF